MKKRILSIALVFCMLLSITPTAFATESATVKIAGTEFTSSSEILPSGVTIDWTENEITLDNATIEVNDTTGAVTSGIEINDTVPWTLELTGTNTVKVTAGAAPSSSNFEAVPAVYGVYYDGSLKISGTGSLNATVKNNNYHSLGVNEYASPAAAICAGSLTITAGAVSAMVTGTTFDFLPTMPVGTANTLAAIYSEGTIEIGGGTVEAKNTAGGGAAIRSNTSISITGGIVNATSDEINMSLGQDIYRNYAIFAPNGTLSVTGGTVSAIATNSFDYSSLGGSPTGVYGVEAKIVNISDDASFNASGFEYGVYLQDGGSITVSSAQTSITATKTDGTSVSGASSATGSISAGTYSHSIDKKYVASGYVQQGTTIVEDSAAADATAWIKNGSQYTDNDGGVKAIEAAKNGDEIYLNVSTTAKKTGLSLGDTITVWVKNGISFDPTNLTFTGEGVEAKVVVGNSDTLEDGTTYLSYVYTMYVAESAAAMQLMRGNEVVGYYSSFGKYSNGAMKDAKNGDTIVMLKNLNLDEFTASFDKSITLDLNGKTISGSSDSVVSTDSTSVVTIVDSSKGQGKIENTHSSRSTVSGNLIINGGTIFSNGHAVLVYDNCTATIIDGTFIGDILLNGEASVVKIYGGNFAQSGFAPSCKGIITVSGTTISGYCGDAEGDTDIEWEVTPITGNVTVNGEELTNLKLTLSGTATMTDYDGEYDRAPWWSMRKQITEVVVSCSDLGNYALADLNNVTALTLNEGLTSIGNNAFQDIPINGALTIPASVTAIGNNAFENCGVTSFAVAGGNSFTAENGVLLNSSKTTIVAYPDGAAQFAAYTAPDTVTAIAPGAFSGSEVKSITINGTLSSAYYLPSFTGTEDYSFEGWYSDSVFSEANKITSTTATAYAKWVSTVTFDANGGTLENNVYSVAHDTAIGTLPTPTWTDDTKEFASWNTQNDGLGTIVTAETVPTGNVTYYAIYKVKNSDVVINPIPAQTYTGSAITPNITYKIGEGDVQTITDAVWTNNTDVGTASTTVTIGGQPYTVTFQITKATYDMSGITFENETLTYDGQAHSLAIGGNLPAGVTVSFEGNGQTNAGTYTVTAKFAGDANNYEAIADKTATLTINKARLTITADDKTMYVGDDVPTLTYTVTGLVEGEALTRKPDVSCSALGDTVGNFAIRVSGAAASSNYWSVITYVDGTLSVENRPVVPSYPGILPSVPSNNVTVEDIENGTIKVSPSYATKGQTVTITVTPDSGYELDELVVLDKNGIAVELTKKSDNQYTFKMPSGKVTVEATFVEAVTENPFVDVAENAYYYDAVLWAVENEITTGTGADTFSPNAVCTRAQVVTFLWRAAGCPEPVGETNEFDDVASNAYYAKAVQWAVEQGITLGTGDNKFSPDTECTRGQIVTFLWRSQGSENAAANNPFVDVADGAYYEDAVLWAVEEAITNGTGADTFSPDADCTRGQIVTFLYRCLSEQ